MNNFDFDSITANSGKVFHMESKRMFTKRKDEDFVRKMVTDVFSGKQIRLPEGPYSVKGFKKVDQFVFDFFFTDGFSLYGCYFPPEETKFLIIYGTKNKDSTLPIEIAKFRMGFYSSCGFADTNSLENLPVINNPYGIDVLTPLALFSDLVLSGMSGEYAKAFTCVAIDILKSCS